LPSVAENGHIAVTFCKINAAFIARPLSGERILWYVLIVCPHRYVCTHEGQKDCSWSNRIWYTWWYRYAGV